MIVWKDLTLITTAIPERHAMLGTLLGSVKRQTLTPGAHMIVVDYEGGNTERAMNQMVKAAETEWIAAIADDDFLYPDHIETLYEHRFNGDWIWTYCKAVPAHRFDLYNRPFAPEELKYRNTVSPVALFRRELYLDYGGYSTDDRHPDGTPYSDWRLAQRMVAGGVKFLSIPKITWEYRFHGANMSWRELVLEPRQIV